MPSKGKNNRRHRKNQLVGFQDTDFQWLAEAYQKKSVQNPALTLEEFAIGYGVKPDLIRPFLNPLARSEQLITMTIGQAADHYNTSTKTIRQWISSGVLMARRLDRDWQVYINADMLNKQKEHGIRTFWHGTTADCAELIKANGFKPKTRGKEVWFTTKEGFARGHALGRAQARRQIPVVFCCNIDTQQYSKLIQRGKHIYVFHTPIGPEVIERMDIVSGGKSRQPNSAAGIHQQVDITVTQAAGKVGVLWWLNEYFALKGQDFVREDSPLVEAIHQWVQDEYAQGRETPITNEEIVKQLSNLTG